MHCMIAGFFFAAILIHMRRFLASLCIEFGPITVFFLTATEVYFFQSVWLLIATTLLALCASLFMRRTIPFFSLMAGVLVIAFSSAALYARNPYWVVLEYTLYNALFAFGIFTAHAWGKPALKPLFDAMFHISDRGWRTLSLRWGAAFAIVALGNELIWRTYGIDAWIEYRFLAAGGLAVFVFSQFFLARRERMPGSSPWGLRSS